MLVGHVSKSRNQNSFTLHAVNLIVTLMSIQLGMRTIPRTAQPKSISRHKGAHPLQQQTIVNKCHSPSPIDKPPPDTNDNYGLREAGSPDANGFTLPNKSTTFERIFWMASRGVQRVRLPILSIPRSHVAISFGEAFINHQ